MMNREQLNNLKELNERLPKVKEEILNEEDVEKLRNTSLMLWKLIDNLMEPVRKQLRLK